jgi:hypothetical protein
MSHPQAEYGEDSIQVEAVNILNKKSQTANKEQPYSLGRA